MEVPKIPSFALSFEKNVFLNQKKIRKETAVKIVLISLISGIESKQQFYFYF